MSYDPRLDDWQAALPGPDPIKPTTLEPHKQGSVPYVNYGFLGPQKQMAVSAFAGIKKAIGYDELAQAKTRGLKPTDIAIPAKKVLGMGLNWITGRQRVATEAGLTVVRSAQALAQNRPADNSPMVVTNPFLKFALGTAEDGVVTPLNAQVENVVSNIDRTKGWLSTANEFGLNVGVFAVSKGLEAWAPGVDELAVGGLSAGLRKPNDVWKPVLDEAGQIARTATGEIVKESTGPAGQLGLGKVLLGGTEKTGSRAFTIPGIRPAVQVFMRRNFGQSVSPVLTWAGGEQAFKTLADSVQPLTGKTSQQLAMDLEIWSRKTYLQKNFPDITPEKVGQEAYNKALFTKVNDQQALGEMNSFTESGTKAQQLVKFDNYVKTDKDVLAIKATGGADLMSNAEYIAKQAVKGIEEDARKVADAEVAQLQKQKYFPAGSEGDALREKFRNQRFNEEKTRLQNQATQTEGANHPFDANHVQSTESPLLTEARKYKSAQGKPLSDAEKKFFDELGIKADSSFTEAEKDTFTNLLKGKIFHGTNSGDNIIKGGFSGGSGWNSGVSFTDNFGTANRYRAMGRGKGTGSNILSIDSKNLKLKDIDTSTMQDIKQGTGGLSRFVKEAKEQGFDGFKDNGGEYLVWNTKKINENITPIKDLFNEVLSKRQTNPLLTEARKYKSAEEFAGSQQQVFRGGTALESGKTTDRGIPFTTDKAVAERFTNLGNLHRENVARIGLDAGPLRSTTEYYLSPSAKIATKADIPAEVFSKYKASNPFVYPEVGESMLGKWAKANGFDGIDYRTLGETSVKEAEIKILNPDVLKTKSQLTDIWEEANKGGATKPTTFNPIPVKIIDPARQSTALEWIDKNVDATSTLKPVRGQMNTFFDKFPEYNPYSLGIFKDAVHGKTVDVEAFKAAVAEAETRYTYHFQPGTKSASLAETARGQGYLVAEAPQAPKGMTWEESQAWIAQHGPKPIVRASESIPFDVRNQTMSGFGKLITNMGLSPKGVSPSELTQAQAQAFGKELRIQVAKDMSLKVDLEESYQTLRSIAYDKSQSRDWTGMFVPKEGISGLTPNDIKAGFKARGVELTDAEAHAYRAAANASRKVPVKVSGLGPALVNALRTMPDIAPGVRNPISASMDGAVALTNIGHFIISPAHAARFQTKMSIFSLMDNGTVNAGRTLNNVGRAVGGLIDKGTNKLANIPGKVFPFLKSSYKLPGLADIFGPELSDATLQNIEDAIYVKKGLGEVDLVNDADMLGSRQYTAAGQTRANNIYLKVIGVDEKQTTGNIIYGYGRNRGLTGTPDQVISQVLENPKMLEEVYGSIEAITHYKAGYLQSPLAKTLNILFYPSRFDTKVLQLTGEFVGRQNPLVQKTIIQGAMDMVSWSESDGGKQWIKDNDATLKIVNNLLPFASIKEMLFGATNLDTGELGLIGGLPFGFVSTILGKMGYIKNTYVSPKSGTSSLQTVPTSLSEFEKLTVLGLLAHFFPMPIYTFSPLLHPGELLKGNAIHIRTGDVVPFMDPNSDVTKSVFGQTKYPKNSPTPYNTPRPYQYFPFQDDDSLAERAWKTVMQGLLQEKTPPTP